MLVIAIITQIDSIAKHVKNILLQIAQENANKHQTTQFAQQNKLYFKSEININALIAHQLL